MKRVVVHIGSQRIASMSIPRCLFANLDPLVACGVLVPETGRLELAPKTVRHHFLAWSLDPASEHPVDPGIWDTLAEEIEAAPGDTVLLSSELLAGVAADERTAPLLRERLHALSDDVTLVLVARDQLGLLNGVYGRRVRALELTDDFTSYVSDSPDLAQCDYAEAFRPWYAGGDTRFVAMPWDADSDTSAEEVFRDLLDLGGIDVPAETLRSAVLQERDELGPVGVEACRLLGGYLRGRFPDFSYGEPAVRRLRRKLSVTATANSWFDGEFWGWEPSMAAAAADRYAPSNQEFARILWDKPWEIAAPVERLRSVSDILELDPASTDLLHTFLIDMESAFRRQRDEETTP